MRRTIGFIFTIFYVFCCSLYSAKVRLLSEIILQEKTKPLERPSSFIRTKDGVFVVSDLQAGDINVYLPSGELIKTFGRRGQGPDEFLSPFALSYYTPHLCLLDIDRRMIFLMKIEADGELKSIQYFSCPGGADKISLANDRVTVSGYMVDQHGVHHSIYQYVFISKEIIPIFPSYEIYGYSSQNEYMKRFTEDISPLGMRILCAQHKDDVFAVWDQNLRILKKNVRTGEVKIFGKKTSHYIRPQNTKTLDKAKKERNREKIQEELDKFSFISAITATDQLFLLIYQNIQPSKRSLFIQIYDHSGNFLEEIQFPSPVQRSMFYISRKESVIYELAYKDFSSEGAYKIRAYGLDINKK